MPPKCRLQLTKHPFSCFCCVCVLLLLLLLSIEYLGKCTSISTARYPAPCVTHNCEEVCNTKNLFKLTQTISEIDDTFIHTCSKCISFIFDDLFILLCQSVSYIFFPPPFICSIPPHGFHPLTYSFHLFNNSSISLSHTDKIKNQYHQQNSFQFKRCMSGLLALFSSLPFPRIRSCLSCLYIFP